jgi:integrase
VGPQPILIDGRLEGLAANNLIRVPSPQSDKDLSISTRKSGLEIEPLTEDEADKLLMQGKRFLGGSYYPHFLFLLSTGCRIGELKAVQWQDINFHNNLTLFEI